MDLGVQAKLLRVLQDQHFRRVGGRDLIEADLRVVAARTATQSRDRRRKAARRLFYRLAGFTIVIRRLRGGSRTSCAGASLCPSLTPSGTATEASRSVPMRSNSLIRTRGGKRRN